MTAGVIVLLGILFVWLGVTGRGKAMWEMFTKSGFSGNAGTSHLQ